MSAGFPDSSVRGLCVKQGQSHLKLEQIAYNVRRKILPDLKVDQALPLHRLFEGLGPFHVTAAGKPRRVRYVVEDGLGYGVEALTRYVRDDDAFEVVLDPNTYEAVEREEEGRAFFTLPHEIGHLVLHPEECFELATIPHHRAMLRAQHKVFFDSEWQANVFGAALAMPAGGLAILEAKGQLTPSAVQTMFKVSAQAAAIRVEAFKNRKDELLLPYRRSGGR